MNWQAINFDWNQARAFLATAQEGSLSAASRALGLTQPTLGRQVSALEDTLGVTLFERVGRSLVLTDAGRELLKHVRGMGDAAGQLSMAASGQSQQIDGHVAITATDIMSVHYLPPILKKLRDIAPGIEVTVVSSNSVQNLMRREADIAIRHSRPTEPDLIARLIGEMSGHLFATPEYLARMGWPETAEDISRCDFIGYDDHAQMVELLNAQGLSLTRKNIRYSSANGVAAWAMVREGLGIGAMSQDGARIAPEVQMVFPQMAVPFPVWLIAHRELHTSKRIRLVYDLLAKEFSTDP